jgi:hypothetical protein
MKWCNENLIDRSVTKICNQPQKVIFYIQIELKHFRETRQCVTQYLFTELLYDNAVEKFEESLPRSLVQLLPIE